MGIRFRGGVAGDETLYVIFDMRVPDREGPSSYQDQRSHLGKLDTGMGRMAMGYEYDAYVTQQGRTVSIIEVSFQDGVPGSELAWFHSFGEEELLRYLMHWVRDALHKALAHEADEMLSVNGMRVFDPHRHGR